MTKKSIPERDREGKDIITYQVQSLCGCDVNESSNAAGVCRMMLPHGGREQTNHFAEDLVNVQYIKLLLHPLTLYMHMRLCTLFF